MMITKASTEDHKALTKLTIESKSHWNYSKEQIEGWLPDLTVTPKYIRENKVFKLTIENELVAYYGYYFFTPKELLLDSMFVSPQFIGKGLGGVMMKDLFERAKVQNASMITVYSDPNSEAFYAKFGFEVIDHEPTSIKNRVLPIMRKNL